MQIAVDDLVTLEARWDVPEDPQAVVVFCHPHPQSRGSMTVPLMEQVTGVLVERGLAVLRFNFRGVRGSTGHWGGGVAEIDDVTAAVGAARDAATGIPLAIAGWSFGAMTSLRWQAAAGSGIPWAGIAPAIHLGGPTALPGPEDLPVAARTIVIGDRDQFTTVEEVESYAASIGARVHVLRGSDHFFYFREDRVGRMVTEALCESCGLDGA
jgi:alpha/beta superfamily hydrolase